MTGSKSREVIGSWSEEEGDGRFRLGSFGLGVGLSAINKRTRPLQRWVELHLSSQL